MLSFEYVVESLDGDYANLRRTDMDLKTGTEAGGNGQADEETKLVARALLPAEIKEGTRLKYEFLQYSIIE